jgi:hypothetical protein
VGLISWLPLLGLAVFAIDQVVDRKRHERLRAVRRVWRETSRTLSAGERSAVGRAVRAGVAVDDPWLAEPAMEMAAAVLAYPPRTPLRRVGDAIFAAWITAPVVIYGFRREWGWMAFAVLWPLLVGLVAVHVPRFRKRAAEALDANRRIRPPREPASRAVGDRPSLAVGLPKSVARVRRMRDHPPPT